MVTVCLLYGLRLFLLSLWHCVQEGKEGETEGDQEGVGEVLEDGDSGLSTFTLVIFILFSELSVSRASMEKS